MPEISPFMLIILAYAVWCIPGALASERYPRFAAAWVLAPIIAWAVFALFLVLIS